MPARVVLVHDDTEFLEKAVAALRAVGHEVAAYSGSRAALSALEQAHLIELLITPITFPVGSPNGVSLALMARHRKREIKILFAALPELREYTDGIGEFLPMPVNIAELVEAASRLLNQSGQPSTK